MYHQVRVKQKDQNSQRFLWRDAKSNAKPDVYVMEVLTFGTNCSPSLAQHIKDKNASEFENEYPKAAAAIKQNHYVDDWLDSTHTVEDAICLAKQVKHVHQQGGFNLRKFISNSKEVLDALGDDSVQQAKNLDVNSTLGTQKILGMWWDAQRDCFTYSLKFTKLNEEVLLGLRAPTKREALKTLMSIYDPLGLIAFFLVYLKVLIQEVWKRKIAWDEQLPDDLNEKWKRWIRFLPMVQNVSIPRLYSDKISPGEAKTIELHTFVDASEYAYCAASYLRIEDHNGVDVVLVGAKTKVAPIKPLLTTPRLELLAAVLGTRLAKSIEQSLTLRIDKRYYWSDSRDVWCWIRSTTRKYRQFVAFRIGEILEETKEEQWRWVPGDINVADEGTKWKKNPNFDSNCRWFRGPEFLYQDESSWPPNLSSGETTEEEIHVHLPIIIKANPHSSIVPENFSKWSRLVNVQALVNRFVQTLKAKINGQSAIKGPLSSVEINQAEITLFKMAQFDCFHSEIERLKNPKKKFGPKSYVAKSSPIYKLSPYLEEDGLLRVKGRIDNIGGVKFDTKRPIILPRGHKITDLLVNNYHRMYLHGNNETVINELKQKFVIPKVRAVVRGIVSQCQFCKNKKAKPTMPEMGSLPVSRLSPGIRPFTYTGVDYFGPINVLQPRGTEKRWGVLFTCLTVRAIHIELVPSLNTDSCILGIRNFTNLRGTPRKFHSDNGTHFKGADNELQKEFQKLDKDKLQSSFTKTYTSWDYNPPAAPHFGGSWERLVASVKNNLELVMFTRTPKEELLRSYLWEVVNIVNSRPLTYVPIDNRDDEVLTPNHFILGSSNGHLAPGEFPFEEKSLSKAWRRSQELTNMFWRRWIKEYLPTLTCRTKWFPKAKPIEPGDVVILVDEKNARNSYPRGVVLHTLPDKHGQVRQATVRVAEVIPDTFGRTTIDAPVRYSIKTRPVAKLAVLDVLSERDGKTSNGSVNSNGSIVDDNQDEVKGTGMEPTQFLNGEEYVNNTDSNLYATNDSNVRMNRNDRKSTLRPRKRQSDSRKPLC
ncbi:uncharacterized protein LOC119077000 [Bradysia coprophila]|uniref:uncharacterized protein LOC119077000 n=1 Tax=Bradysia coprophila TaxID=38358 RepID=UPI00187DD41D|nr:uncharacterized protein LOC119077000 [Bradysia coprophila]XP_037040001.1 uncharacterized protein LOC119077000 [Bradysia coprophila]XP_037040002.1 uncharacterized protein LOC119077000 [Bradysia coprophila]